MVYRISRCGILDSKESSNCYREIQVQKERIYRKWWTHEFFTSPLHWGVFEIHCDEVRVSGIMASSSHPLNKRPHKLQHLPPNPFCSLAPMLYFIVAIRLIYSKTSTRNRVPGTITLDDDNHPSWDDHIPWIIIILYQFTWYHMDKYEHPNKTITISVISTFHVPLCN